MTGRTSPTLLQRSALGLWFAGLGVLGLARWAMRHARDGSASDIAIHAWLFGSLALTALGAWLLARAFVAHRRHARGR